VEVEAEGCVCVEAEAEEEAEEGIRTFSVRLTLNRASIAP
jgi:hypothetical protein